MEQWVGKLRNGRIERVLPSPMKLYQATTVKVIVHGVADTAAPQLPGAHVAELKVSPRMAVTLTAEDNPDEFTIEAQSDPIQFVPLDGTATWLWRVTPKQPASNQKLTIRAKLVYPDNSGQSIEEEITSYTDTVNVNVPGLWASLKKTFWDDPGAVAKYLLPGAPALSFSLAS